MTEISRETAHSHLVNTTRLGLLMKRQTTTRLPSTLEQRTEVLCRSSHLRKCIPEREERVRLSTRTVMSRRQKRGVR
jgi:hypothetical protein